MKTYEFSNVAVVMTQVQFGALGFTEFEPVPDLLPTFNGVVGTVPRGMRTDPEKPRRKDGLVPHFGQGTPTVDTSEVDIHGIAKATAPVAYQSVSTSEGPMNVPLERAHFRYQPSVDSIDFLTHAQYTRLQPLPDRYFR